MDFTKIYIWMSNHPLIQEQCPEYSSSFYRLGVWLPRQDEIQEMCKNESGIWAHLSNKFFKYYTQMLEENHGWFIVFDTIEKAWLVFYMHEKHNLTWNGEKWEKEK